MSGFATDTGFPNDALRPGSAPYYLVRFAPPETRHDLAALFAWYHELERLRRIREPQIARVKLNWWREELSRAVDGSATHPAARTLAPVLRRDEAARTRCEAIASALDRHLELGSYPDAAALAVHHQATDGIFAVLLAGVVPGQKWSENEVRNAGTYHGMVETLRRLGAELAVPAPRLGRSARQRLLAAKQDTSARTAVVSDLCVFADSMRPSSAARLPAPIRAVTNLATARLAEVRRSGTAVLDVEIDLTPLRTLWIVWRSR